MKNCSGELVLSKSGMLANELVFELTVVKHSADHHFQVHIRFIERIDSLLKILKMNGQVATIVASRQKRVNNKHCSD